MKHLSRNEMKHIMGGDEELDDILICGGTGNFIMKCHCKAQAAVFYCCNLGTTACITEKGCGSDWLCVQK